MKSFIVFALFVAAAVAAPAGPEAEAVVVRNDLNNIGVEGFQSAVETSNGIRSESQGELVAGGTDDAHLIIRGQFSYTGPDGVLYSVSYVADKEGFRAEGAHLPKAL